MIEFDFGRGGSCVSEGEFVYVFCCWFVIESFDYRGWCGG